jgi:hypothetical protein
MLKFTSAFLRVFKEEANGLQQGIVENERENCRTEVPGGNHHAPEKHS